MFYFFAQTFTENRNYILKPQYFEYLPLHFLFILLADWRESNFTFFLKLSHRSILYLKQFCISCKMNASSTSQLLAPNNTILHFHFQVLVSSQKNYLSNFIRTLIIPRFKLTTHFANHIQRIRLAMSSPPAPS